MENHDRIEIESIFLLQAQIESKERSTNISERIWEAIETEKEYAVSDTSLKDGKLGEYQVLTGDKKLEIIENTLY